ncbi:alpha/beta hydrolase [Saccharothrix sp. NPDC042600]|uniref:alpha/beta fold hydrolase n=1 Tax=Saccharothrix TaxID=2071 RepID=UPI003402705A|nr:alpha/beta hydrolase [Saccharothrix mutabilis subsp. capreolus]
MVEFPALEGVSHRFLDLPGLRAHVAEAGDGDPVLLLHGFPQHWWEWRKVVPGLAGRRRVVCPDLRGAGWTDAPRRGYDYETLRGDLVALLDALDLERVDVVAHDWSAIVVFRMCLDDPDRFRRFVAIGVPPPFLDFDWRMLGALRHAWYQFALITPGLGPWLVRHGGLPQYLLTGFAAPGASTPADVEIFLERLRDPARAKAGSLLYRKLITPESRRILTGRYKKAHLKTPTRVLLGTQDPVVRPDLVHGYEDQADDLEVVAVPGAAHFVPEERPKDVVARVLEFVDAP